MKQSYLAFLASLVFACLVSLVLGYMYGAAQYSKHSSVYEFEKLPQEIQDQYIQKDEVAKMQSLLSIKKEHIAPLEEPIEGTTEELKAQINELRGINHELYRENVELSDKGWELALKLKEKEREVLSEKERLKAKSLENINEAEQQHYQNVNDLTKRINQLQQQSITTTKNYEKQIVVLENKVDALKQNLQQKEFEVNEEINAATQKERISNKTLAEKNRHLLDQIKVMKTKMTQRMKENSSDLQVKKDEIMALKQNLNEKEMRNNSLLTKQTQELLNIEQKHTTTLKALRDNMMNLQQQHKEDIALKNSEISALVAASQKEIQKLKNTIQSDETAIKKTLLEANNDLQLSLDAIITLKSANKTLTKEKNLLEKQLKAVEEKIHNLVDKKEQEYAQMFQELKSETSNYKEQKEQIIANLEKQALQDHDSMEALKSMNAILTQDFDTLKTKLNQGVKKEVFERNEKKHAQNYKILNSKIIALKKERDSFDKTTKEEIKSFKEQLAKKENDIKKLNEEHSQQLASLQTEGGQLNELAAAVKEKDRELLALKKSFVLATKEKEKIEKELQLKSQNEGEKLESLQALLEKKDQEINQLNSEYKAQIASLEDSMAKNKQKLEKELLAAQKTDNSKLKKSLEQSLAKIASLEDDISMLVREKKTLLAKVPKAQQKDELKSKLALSTKELKEAQSSISSLQSDLDALKQENRSIMQEKDELALAGKKEFEALKRLLNDTKTSLQNIENEAMSLKGDIVVLEKTNKDLLTENKILAQNQDEKQAKQQQVKQDFDAINSDLLNAKAELLALKREFDSTVKTNLSLKEELDKTKATQIVKSETSQVSSLEAEIDKLTNENIDLLTQIENIQTPTTTPTAKTKRTSKLELTQSITCDDMQKGTNAPTNTCKTRVREFLAEYGTEYFFEVVPIVDEGGFASLNKVARSQLGIPSSEISRLTRLSNLGLGKDRAASGGELIEEILGDNVRISYAVTNKDVPKKRGFIINAYK